MRINTFFVPSLAALVLFHATAAVAQRQPTPFPWEQKSERYFNQRLPNPNIAVEEAFQRNLRRLGLPSQRRPTTPEDDASITLDEANLTRYRGYDSNLDGTISRAEYLDPRSRDRVRTPYWAGQSAKRRRLESQFRAADRNRDGSLSATELGGLRSPKY